MHLRGTNYTTNNTVLLLDNIGSTSGALRCETDLEGCCVDKSAGQWLYPNGTEIPEENEIYGFYRLRKWNGRIFLRRNTTTVSPTGTYCCQVPTAADNTSDETFCVFLSK